MANGSNFVPPTLTTTETIYYRRQVLANGGGAGCEAFSDVHEIRVNDIQPGQIDPNSTATYCYGSNPGSINSVTEATSEFGALSYQWQSRTAATGWTNIDGAINNNYDPGSLIETTFFRRSVTATQSGTSCFESSNEITINILPELNTGGILANQVICENTQPADLNLNGATSGAGVTYQWQQSIDSDNWTDMGGEVSTTLQFSTVATETRYYRAVVTSEVNTPTALDQMQISLTKNANALAVGEIYYVKIGSGTYSFTTTGATSHTDGIGAGLSQQINDNAPGVSSSYDPAVNLISIVPLQNEISIKTSVSTASHDLKVLSSVTGDGCNAITDSIVIEVEQASTLTQTGGNPNSTALCPGESIGFNPGDEPPLVFEWGGGATSARVESLNPAYGIIVGPGGTITDLGGGFWRVEGVNSLTITGTAGPANNFTVRTEGSGCTEQNLDYSIVVKPQAEIPNVIMKDQNSIYNAVINHGGKWYNNTVCQENENIDGGPVTSPTDFYTCFINNGFNVLYNDFEWKLDPPTAGTIVENEFQTATVKITSNSNTVSASNEYRIIINGTTISPNIAEGTTINNLGIALRNAINGTAGINALVTASWSNGQKTLTIKADETNPPAPLYTFSRLNPTNAGNHAFMEEPAISVSTQKMTVNWASAFSGTVTVSVRTTGCGSPSDYYNVIIDVVPETVPSTTASGVTPPEALNKQLCNGAITGPVPSCEVHEFTRNTQFFSASEGAFNNYGSLNWEILDLPGGSIDVTNPGTIDSRGVVDWNMGYWGPFQIRVTPVSCDSTTGTPVTSEIFTYRRK